MTDIKIETLPPDNRMFPIIATIGKHETYLSRESALFLRNKLTEALERIK